MLPRGLPSSDITLLHRYYAPSDFLNIFSAFSLLHSLANTPFPVEYSGSPTFALLLSLHAMLLDPEDDNYSSRKKKMLQLLSLSRILKLSAIPTKIILLGSITSALWLTACLFLCLRLTHHVTVMCPRLSTRCTRFVLSRSHFQ